MDFGIQYSDELEKFRREVRSWLEENVPEEMHIPIDRQRDFTPEMHEFWKGIHRKMGEKGWLFPTYPTKYGGGGLTGDHESILQEELYRLRAATLGARGNPMASILVWGTEEQKQKFLVPILTGEKRGLNRLTEPHSGADLADYRTRAIKDGDDWVITGQNVFNSGSPDVDFLIGPALTDPDAPRHRNLGYFVIPNGLPGVEIRPMALLMGNGQNAIFLDNVRIPGDHLIGGETQGWQVLGTHLEFEHGGGGQAFTADEVVEALTEYAKTAQRDGQPVGADPIAQQTTVDAYLEAHVDGLLAKKAYWMYQNKMFVQYEGNIQNVHHRLYSLRNAIRVRDVTKLDCFLDTREPRAPFGGLLEVNQRSAAGQHHAAGSTNIAKVVLARRIGISRTKERAAPTPSTVSTESA